MTFPASRGLGRPVAVLAALTAAGLIATVLPLAGQSRTDSWSQFRGPSGGVAQDHPDLPDRWSNTENVSWVTDIPGTGWSSPVIAGDHVFVTTVIPAMPQEAPRAGIYLGDWPASPVVHRWVALDLDLRSGSIRWQREVKTSPPGHAKHLKNSYASETPVTDGERVFFYFGNVGLFAFDLEGRPLWSNTVGPFKTRNNWGTGASPVLHEGRLFLVSDTDDQSFLAALDARTGREIWRVDRDEGTNWSTPFVWRNELRTEIVTNGSDRVRSYDLDGELLWELTGMSEVTIPTPLAAHGLLYISSGYLADPNRPVFAIRPGAAGDISLKATESHNSHVVWSLPAGAPYNPSPIVLGDIYYTLFDRGFFTSHDARTGRPIYPRQRIATDAGGFTASPWAYNGKIFAADESGDTYVIQAGPEFRVVGKNSLGEMIMASPAIAGGRLLIRTASKLYCLTAAARPL